MFIEPMLAAPMPKKPLNLSSGDYVMEEKFDGHRLIVHIAYGQIRAWSRLGNVKVLPPHLEAMRDALPPGIYDGELLVPGKRSYNVTELDEFRDLVFVAFDMLHDGDVSDFNVFVTDSTPNLLRWTYRDRRQRLEASFDEGWKKPSMRHTYSGHDAWQLARVTPAGSTEQVTETLTSIWNRDGEGLILKRLSAPYEPGKRPKLSWIKMKSLRSAVLTFIGYQAGKLGPQATQVLKDKDGNVTTVKWKNMDLLSKFNADPQAYIGRQVRIEYQERTPDGNYRHPRWDRFEDE